MDKMNIITVRKKARDLGVQAPKNTKKPELIRAIQAAEGNIPCYATNQADRCGQDTCCWRPDCVESMMSCCCAAN